MARLRDLLKMQGQLFHILYILNTSQKRQNWLTRTSAELRGARFRDIRVLSISALPHDDIINLLCLLERTMLRKMKYIGEFMLMSLFMSM